MSPVRSGRQLNRPEYVLSLMAGEFPSNMDWSKPRVARSLAELMEQAGQAQTNVSAQMQARLFRGMTCYHLREFVTSRELP
jgi:hypothetical protein